MIQHKDHFHGSDLEKIEAAYGIKKEEIVSFAANVNPLGISPLLRETIIEKIDAIASYPDREYASLRRCIADYCGTDAENVIVGNGSTELISLFIQILRPRRAMVLGPTYSEYEREIALGGGTALYYPLREEDQFRLDVADFASHLGDGVDMLILCNPNNPTSTAIRRGDMRRVLDVCKRYGISVMVDETYVEFATDCDAVTAVPLANDYDNLVVLRGTSKFFAAPGLRLGYAVTGGSVLKNAANARKNPWTINSLAVVAGEAMFKDADYIKKTRKLVSGERSRVFSILSDTPGFHPYAPDANFVLVRITRDGLLARDLFERAIRQKMMIRDCSTFPFLDERYFRFCFMKPEDDDRLLECLNAL